MRFPLATATQVKLCPHCEAELPVPRPAVCPFCLRAMPQGKSQSAQFFECPDYLYFQKQALARRPDEKPKQGLPEAYATTLLAVNDDLTLFVRKSTPETLVAAVFDAHVVMSHLMHSSIGGDDLKKVVATARAIGRLGETIDQYIRAGGTLHDDDKTREARPVLPAAEGDYWSATAAADSGG